MTSTPVIFIGESPPGVESQLSWAVKKNKLKNCFINWGLEEEPLVQVCLPYLQRTLSDVISLLMFSDLACRICNHNSKNVLLLLKR